MQPEFTKQNYDKLAHWFQEQHVGSRYGLAQLERAISFCVQRGSALDVGCGSSGRFLQAMFQSGFQAEGLDISSEMIALAERNRPDAVFYNDDVCIWRASKPYNLVTAWDSTFHLPLEQQEPVLRKLCAALAEDGIILFTCGSSAGEICGEMQGLSFGYSSLGVARFVQVLEESSCLCLHVEHDQWPENHVYIIGKKK